jgi:hypothetical protein
MLADTIDITPYNVPGASMSTFKLEGIAKSPSECMILVLLGLTYMLFFPSAAVEGGIFIVIASDAIGRLWGDEQDAYVESRAHKYIFGKHQEAALTNEVITVFSSKMDAQKVDVNLLSFKQLCRGSVRGWFVLRFDTKRGSGAMRNIHTASILDRQAQEWLEKEFFNQY